MQLKKPAGAPESNGVPAFSCDLQRDDSSRRRQAGDSLSRFLEQLTFGEFLGYLPTPTCIAHVGVKPTEGNAVLEINPSLVLPMLDIVLGGDGKHTANQTKELTDIEQSLIRRVLDRVIVSLEESWRSVMNVNATMVGMEESYALIQVATPGEIVAEIEHWS